MKKTKYSGIVEEHIKTTDSIQELNLLMTFFEFLYALGISSAFDVLDRISDTIVDEFCDDCEIPKENCECGRYNRWNDPDHLYDLWKDRQMENDLEK